MRMLKQNILDVYTEVIGRLPPYYSLKNIEKEEVNGGDENNEIQMIADRFVGKRKVTSGIMG